MATDLVSSLARVPLFAGLAERDLSSLARDMKERTFAAGTEITREGRSGVGFFVILEGEAVVRIAGSERRRLGPGDWFGEIALIDEGPRSASVTAEGEVRAAGLSAWEFAPFVKGHPDVAWTLLRTLASRLRDAETG